MPNRIPPPAASSGTTTLLRDESQDYQDHLEQNPDPEETAAEKRERERKAQIVKTALERFRLILEVEGDQRDREVDDLRFDRALTEDQWPEAIRKARAGGTAADGTVIHERPCLVINKLDQPVQQIINEARKARLAIIVKPKGNGASKDGAELRQGMIRAIEQDSRANLARIWALERAVKCGRGAYRVLKAYANDGDFDLDLVITRIKNQGCVYLDPYAQEPDWSDGEYGFITDDMPIREYKRLYGESAMASKSAEELQSVSDQSKGWVTTDREGTIRVAEYFYVEYEARTLVRDPKTGKGVLLPAGEAAPPNVKSRPVDVRKVKWCVINAVEVLDEEDWEGRYIPIIPTVGKEYNVNGKSAWKGVISNAKDSQRLYNYARSSQALRSGLESLAPWVMAEGQDEGYQQMWDEANTRAFTRLIYKPTTFEGQLLPPPSRNDLNSTNLSASVLMAREADMDIQATTGRFNPSLGKQDGARSGKAINALKLQGENTSSNYLENLANISLIYEAKVLLDLLPIVYDRPGRIIRLLGDSPKDEREVLLGQAFIPGPDGRPMLAEPNAPGLIKTLMDKVTGKAALPQAKTYILNRDEDYSVVVSVGPSFASQQDADGAYLDAVMQAAPQMVPYLLDIRAELSGGQIGERVKKRLLQINPKLKDEEAEGESAVPPQVQAELQQLQQQNQALMQELQKAKAGVLTEEIRSATAKELKAMELASRERIEAKKLETVLVKTDAELGSKESIATMSEETKRGAKLSDQVHESRMKLADVEAEHLAAERQAALEPPYPKVKAEKTYVPPDQSVV